jgi:hypothetical protein
MLNEEIEKFEKLTGHSANYYSMEFLGGFWFGYDTASKEEKPQGEWQKVGKYACECSICGESVCGDFMNFCPNCGALMKNSQIPEAVVRRAIKTKKDGQAPQQNETK